MWGGGGRRRASERRRANDDRRTLLYESFVALPLLCLYELARKQADAPRRRCCASLAPPAASRPHAGRLGPRVCGGDAAGVAGEDAGAGARRRAVSGRGAGQPSGSAGARLVTSTLCRSAHAHPADAAGGVPWRVRGLGSARIPPLGALEQHEQAHCAAASHRRLYSCLGPHPRSCSAARRASWCPHSTRCARACSGVARLVLPRLTRTATGGCSLSPPTGWTHAPPGAPGLPL